MPPKNAGVKLIKFSSLSGQIAGLLEQELRGDCDYREAQRRIYAHAVDFADYYKKHLEAEHQCETEEVLLSSPGLRKRWYAEHPSFIEGDNLQYALDQIAHFKPDVVFDQARVLLPVIGDLKKKFPFIRCTTTWDGWIASEPAQMRGYDLYFTCVPEILEKHLAVGHRCTINPFGFETSLLERIHVPDERINRVCFVGSLSSGIHNLRNRVLNELRREEVLDWWIGNIGQGLFTRSKLRELAYGNFRAFMNNIPFELHNRGKLYGLEMYQTMAQYQLTINIHGDQVQNIGNMRLTEAGGVGTCQLIDWKPNAETYFKPDEEAVFFRTVDELKSKVRYLLEHPEEARKIGEAAQKRVLREYSFAAHVSRFMHEVRAFLG